MAWQPTLEQVLKDNAILWQTIKDADRKIKLLEDALYVKANKVTFKRICDTCITGQECLAARACKKGKWT